MMNRVEKCMVAARRVWGFIWKECTGFRAPYYSWHPQMPCVHIITTLNWGFFRPIFFYSFPSSSSPRKLFLGRGGGCVIKRRPVVVGGTGGAEWHTIKGRTVWVDAATLLLHVEVSWSVTDLSVTQGFFSSSQTEEMCWSLVPHHTQFNMNVFVLSSWIVLLV